jgi:hypothetical protein
MRGTRQVAWGLTLAAGCGSNGAALVADAGRIPPDASESGLASPDVGPLGPVAVARHVLLRAGAPAQREPSLAISGGVLGVAMHASRRPETNDWHLRFGVTPIQPDRTAGTFSFTDLAEPAYAAHVESAGASGFHVLWLTGQGAPMLRYSAFDLQGQSLSQPITLGAATEFGAAANPIGGSLGVAVRLSHSSPVASDEILVGLVTSSSAFPAALTSVEMCPSTSLSIPSASTPALAWSGDMLDVYYECASQGPSGAPGLRHVRVDASGALAGPPSTVDPVAGQFAAPLAVSSTLYWLRNDGWTKGAIDPSSGALSLIGPADFSGTARGVVTAREGTWALETACAMGEDMPPRGGFTACPWDSQGQRLTPCVTFTATNCSKAAMAGNGDAAFVAFEAGDDNLWLLPLGAAPAAGAEVYPAVIGRGRTVKPRRVYCDALWNCVALVDEPAVDIVVGSGDGSFVDPGTGLSGWTEDPWRDGESSSLAWYSLDGSASPSVTVIRSAQRFVGAPPILADQLSVSGVGLISGGMFSLLGVDGSVTWQVPLPDTGSAYLPFTEGDRFRLFRDEFPTPALSEYVVNQTGILSTKTIASRAGDSPAWTDATITACAGVYLATGPYVGAILRYAPSGSSSFAVWQQDPGQAIGCAAHLVGAIDRPTGGIASANAAPVLSLWNDDGASVATAMLGGWSPSALAFASDARGFAWLGWGGLGADAGSGSFDVVRVTASSVARGQLASPPSVAAVVGLHAVSTSPGSVAAIYCDKDSGDCWLSNWRD